MARLLRGGVWTAAGLGIALASSMLAGIGTARLLGANGFGQLAVVRSTLTMLGVFAGANLVAGVSRFVAQYLATDPERTARGIRMLLLAALTTGSVVAAAIVVLAPVVAAHLSRSSEIAGAVAIGALVIVFTTVSSVQNGILFGLHAFRAAAVVAALEGIVSAIALVAGAYGGGLRGAVAGMTAGAALGCGVRHRLLQSLLRRRGITATRTGASVDFRVLSAHGLPAMLFGIVTQPSEWIVRILLARGASGFGEVGVFTAAFAWGQAALLLPAQLNRPAVPVLATLREPHDELELQHVSEQTRRLSTASAVMIAVPLILCSPFIMRAYGSGFARGAATLCVTAISAIIASQWTSRRAVLLSREDPWLQVRYGLAWTSLLLASFFALRSFGAVGLAASYFIAYTGIVIIEALVRRQANG